MDFHTSVISKMFMHYFDSFLYLQDTCMFLSLQVFAFEGKNINLLIVTD